MTERMLRRLVARRAGQRCEYCRMHQSLQGGRFHLDHIQPQIHGGPRHSDNLALACVSCNFSKADRAVVPNGATGKAIPLFNPRRDVWNDHFRFEGWRIIGISEKGRALVAAFRLNSRRRQRIRRAEAKFALFPP